MMAPFTTQAMNSGSHTRLMLHEPEIAYPMGWNGHHGNLMRAIIRPAQKRNPTTTAPFAIMFGGCGVRIQPLSRLYASPAKPTPERNLACAPMEYARCRFAQNIAR